MCYPAQWDGLSSGHAVTVFSHAPTRAAGFLGRWGTVCLPAVSAASDTVPIRSRTWTLRLPAILHRHLSCHAHAMPRSAQCQVLQLLGPDEPNVFA